ncbi:MAG: flagellar FliJ family protein [Alphaproteobacteria bacterium]|nr:flagellar FliJ family protein [Alphaproteobacteria bacterium]
MKDALKTLERVKKFEIDEQRRILMQKLQKQEALQKNLSNLIEEYEQEKEFVSQNPTICDFGAYTEQYLKKRRALEEQIADVQAEIDKIRDEMADMFKEQKTFEIITQNRKMRKIKELDYQEQKLLDEVGTNSYIKKHKQ